MSLEKNVPGIPDDDYEVFDHIYMRNLYEVLKSWRELLDNHSKTADTKMILSEEPTRILRYTVQVSLERAVQFYVHSWLEQQVQRGRWDFKRLIDRWMNNIPNDSAYVANSVVDNHDNHRAAFRFGEKRVDQLFMLETILPGVSVIYNSDEIGMLDRNFTYMETKESYRMSRWTGIE